MYSKGLIEKGSYLSVRALEGSGQLGIGTAKKLGCHARRNRVRRRVLATMKPADLDPRLDFVVVAAPSADRASFKDLGADLDSTMKRITARWAARSESI